jgi:radical SAM/Cys-rich protein
MTRAAAKQLEQLDALDIAGKSVDEADFAADLAAHGWDEIQPAVLDVFQINLGRVCNMSCKHCHVDAGPDRTEQMDDDVLEGCLRAVERSGAQTVDITGGAPELHPRFRELVDRCAVLGKHVIDRCNLTVLLLPRCAELPRWLAERNVEVVASLPHHRRRNTDAQRGEGAFDRSITALQRLNEAGYGQGDPRRVLTLMTNPAGAYLAAGQRSIEREWKDDLRRSHGVSFDRLIALNNMPIARFQEWLLATGNLRPYQVRLVEAFNPQTISGVMCRNTLSVSWDGRLYDCDFNQMLDLQAVHPTAGPLHVEDFDPVVWSERRIRTARHCYGCTAGAGSSCGGATVR